MKKILAAITEDSLDRAKRHVARELEDHGFWTDRVQQTDVYLTPLSITAYGWQYYRGSGDIAIPRVNGHRMLTKSLGSPGHTHSEMCCAMSMGMP